jgi:hypothetical protein
MSERSTARRPSPLSLTQPTPPNWHLDRPAFAGDEFMDWESETERPPDETLAGPKSPH